MALLLMLGTGCRSLTGRPLGRWVDDHALTAAVKTRLAAMRASTLTRINVDTYEGTVYLSGIVQDEETKRRAEAIARAVDNVDQVVTNLQVQNGSALGAASPPTERQMGIGPGLGMSHPLQARLRGLSRIQGDPVAHPRGPFVAYDGNGRAVATIYTISGRDLADETFDDLEPQGLRIDHVAIYPIAAYPDVPDLQDHVVLWHVSRGEAARLQ
jgi:hypothetical protein